MTRALVDTHALVWWLEGREQLSARALAVIEDSETEIYVSAASAWELAIKSQIGKFRSNVLVRNLDQQIQEEGFIELPISIEHALRAGLLSGAHTDPFDRMLVAQAQVENLPVISKDEWLDDYSVQRIW